MAFVGRGKKTQSEDCEWADELENQTAGLMPRRYFYRKTEKQNGFISIWYRSPFTDPMFFPGVLFPAAEHYMHYQKAKIIGVSLFALKVYELVEASLKDKLWGNGMVADVADRRRNQWGENLLGYCLMMNEDNDDDADDADEEDSEEDEDSNMVSNDNDMEGDDNGNDSMSEDGSSVASDGEDMDTVMEDTDGAISDGHQSGIEVQLMLSLRQSHPKVRIIVSLDA
ncbi:hypothetical protein E8E14_002488 [Neopestalotiopsis sp. 37M]|nr:hypothetical protein E8E14_002488 [Neopestalotiopsis sp. 37M]